MDDSRKEEFEKQYSCSQWSKRGNADEVLKWHIEKAKQGTASAKETCECKSDVSYGDDEWEKYDVYYPGGPPQDWPVFVYIHGGYWQLLSKEYGGFMAKSFTSEGCVVVALGYPLAPGASLPKIIKSARLGIKSIQKEFSKSRIFLCGHSAGAHLAYMAASSDEIDAVEGVILISGIYDLRPLVLTTLNNPLKMDEEVALKCSPANYVSKCPKACKTVIVVGENDSPAFKEQKIDFAKALREAGVSHCEEIEMPILDHFNLVEKLEEPDYELTKRILSLIKN